MEEQDLVGQLAQLETKLDDARKNVATRNQLDQALVEQQQWFRRRIFPLVTTAIAVVLIVGVMLAINNRILSDVQETGEDARLVADFVQNCILNPESLAANERRSQCGGMGGDGAATAVRVLINFSGCAFSVPEVQRTAEHLAACEKQAFAQGGN